LGKSNHVGNLAKRTILYFVCIAAGTIFALSGTALAATSPQQELVGTLDNVRNLLIAVGTVVAAIGYVITAYMWMLSNGNPEQRYRARKYFVDVTFGIFLLFASSFLVALAQSLVA
jgi:type IV secretory pathway VirB2 component (pilin)